MEKVSRLDVIEAIEKRRSIRKYKDTALSERQLEQLLKAAQLAPSGCNVQPWRFIIVQNKQLKKKLCDAAFNQKFVVTAPVVMVCCGDLLSWKTTKKRTQELLHKENINLSSECETALNDRMDKAIAAEIHERIPTTLLNVAIAIEHIVLEAVELGLGSCWIRLFDENKIKQLLNLPDHICVAALLPIGIPDEKPAHRPRLTIPNLILERP